MKGMVTFLFAFLFVASTHAVVRVFVEESNALAWVKYECTAGEVVRAFALDVSVDQGRFIGISDFFKGPSTSTAQGYGILPTSFRDHLAMDTGTNLNWDINGYTPVAGTTENPSGLNSRTVPLEFGGLWDVNVPAAVPGPSGVLCSLQISERAMVSVAANPGRGGIVAAEPDVVLVTEFVGAVVQPPQIMGMSLSDGLLTITFAGGELESAPTIVGPWTGTGNSSGEYKASVADEKMEFFRVHHP